MGIIVLSRRDRRRSPRFTEIEHRRGSSRAVRSREAERGRRGRGPSREVGEVGARMEGSWNLPWTSRDFEIEYEVGRRARADLSDRLSPCESLRARRASPRALSPRARRIPGVGRARRGRGRGALRRFALRQWRTARSAASRLEEKMHSARDRWAWRPRSAYAITPPPRLTREGCAPTLPDRSDHGGHRNVMWAEESCQSRCARVMYVST